MDLTLTDEQELISGTAREFLEARCPISHVQDMDSDPAGFSSDLWKEMAELGWMGLAFPEEHGGYGAGFLELCLIVEQMGRHLLPGPFLPTELCGLAVARHGTDEQKGRVLGGIAGGESILTYARAAPRTGWPSRGSSVGCRAEGAGFILSGSAPLVPFAHVADELLVFGQAPDQPDHLTALLVPTQAVDTEPQHAVGGDRLQRVSLEGVEVTSDRVIGGEGQGRDVLETLQELGTAATCAEMVGGAQKVLDMTVAYASEREQFGAPIGSFQAIQHHCADMGVDVLASRLMAYEAIWRLSEGMEAREEVSMAKAWVSEAYRRVCALGHQVHGAIGFTREHELHHYLRHAVATELSFGDGDHHWARIADHLGLP
ncbi:MAG: acyl-CoA dehydrogenase family protein [Actinomycetota bacterium]